MFKIGMGRNIDDDRSLNRYASMDRSYAPYYVESDIDDFELKPLDFQGFGAVADFKTQSTLRRRKTYQNKNIVPSAKELETGLKPHSAICFICYALLSLTIFSFIFFPANFVFILTLLAAILGVLSCALRLVACLFLNRFSHDKLATQIGDVNEEDWPFYSVLVPLYRETSIVPILMRSLSQLDYPLIRHEIFIICEADDPETIEAVESEISCFYAGGNFRLIKVPPSFPRTKPKALNVALKQAKGAIVTIYDAEDRPHPKQLKIAALELMRDPDLGAVQAPLDYFNHDTNWLTRQFALEYGVLFHIWLPFLRRLGLPFPLGGTSNSIRRDALKKIGGWDSYNVTEDADLSFRLSALGYNIGYVTPPTGEEAVKSWGAWQHQRSRWIKGYIQTWLVHMSKPLAPGGKMGVIRFFTIQLTIGSTILAGLVHLPYLIWLVSSSLLLSFDIEVVTPALWAWPALVLCYLIGVISAVIAAIKLRKPRLFLSALSVPIYWLLLFPATIQAIVEFFHVPFRWNKTEHGIDNIPAIKPGA